MYSHRDGINESSNLNACLAFLCASLVSLSFAICAPVKMTTLLSSGCRNRFQLHPFEVALNHSSAGAAKSYYVVGGSKWKIITNVIFIKNVFAYLARLTHRWIMWVCVLVFVLKIWLAWLWRLTSLLRPGGLFHPTWLCTDPLASGRRDSWEVCACVYVRVCVHPA